MLAEYHYYCDVNHAKLVQGPHLQREDEVRHRRLLQEYIVAYSDSKSVCFSNDASYLLHNTSKFANLYLFNPNFTNIARVSHYQCRASKSVQSIPWNAPATSKDKAHSHFSTLRRMYSTRSASRTEMARAQHRKYQFERTCRMTASKYCLPP